MRVIHNHQKAFTGIYTLESTLDTSNFTQRIRSSYRVIPERYCRCECAGKIVSVKSSNQSGIDREIFSVMTNDDGCSLDSE